MRFTWWRHRDQGAEPSDADAAIEISERRRDRAVEQRRELERLADRIRRMRERNHLAEAFREAFGGGR